MLLGQPATDPMESNGSAEEKRGAAEDCCTCSSWACGRENLGGTLWSAPAGRGAAGGLKARGGKADGVLGL